MKIKEVEQRVGITSQNIRFYEKMGLIHPVRNEENNYREYSEADVWLLERIKLLRVLGVPISEIKLINEGKLTLQDAMNCRIAELRGQEQEIKGMMRMCSRIAQSAPSLEELNGQLFEEEAEMLDVRLPEIFKADITRTILTGKQLNFTVMIMLVYGYILNMVISLAAGNYLLNYNGQGITRQLGAVLMPYETVPYSHSLLEQAVLIVFMAGYVGIYMTSNLKLQLVLYHLVTVTLTPIFASLFNACEIHGGENTIYNNYVLAAFWGALAVFVVGLYFLYLLNEAIAAKLHYMVMAAVIFTAAATAFCYVWIGEIVVPGIVLLVFTIYLAVCWTNVNKNRERKSMYYAIIVGNRIMNF